MHPNRLFYLSVSIHAPHEGERLYEYIIHHNCQFVFQSTLPTRGSDLNIKNSIKCYKMFQSTLPTRGSDDS